MEHVRITSKSENQMTEVIKSEQPYIIPELFKDYDELFNVNAESVYSNDSKEYIVFPITRFSKRTYIRADAGLYFRTPDPAKVMKCVLDVNECKRLDDAIFCLVKPITTEKSVKVSSSLFSEDEECMIIKSESSLFIEDKEYLRSDVRDMGEISDISHTLTCALNVVNTKCDKDLDPNKCDIDRGNVSVNHDEESGLHVDKEIHVNLDELKTEDEEEIKVRPKRKAKTKQFSSEDELNRHKNVQNDNYECNDCGRLFHKMKDLTEHEAQVHAKLYPEDLALTEKLKVDKDIKKKWSRGRRNKKNPFTCIHCEEEFQSEGFLKSHIAAKHENEYKCNVCDQVCRNITALRKHTKTHTKSFGCGICSKSFVGRKTLEKHMKVHSDDTKKREKGTICQVCGKYIASKYSIGYHMRIHNGEKPYQCDRCEAAFSFSQQLQIHLNQHSGIQPYICPTCGDGFYNHSALFRHKKHKHTTDSDMRFACSFCDKKFSLKDFLMRHEKVHTGVKPFKCEFCTMSFSQSGNLKTHMRTHTQEKPFSCTECNASFSHKVSLKTHMSKH